MMTKFKYKSGFFITTAYVWALKNYANRQSEHDLNSIK